MHVAFNTPFWTGGEMEYIREALAGGHAAGDGPFSQRCSALLQSRFGIHRALLTTSATAALEIAALLLEVRTGDEIVMPSFTFPSTASAFMRVGARPVFVDIDPRTLNIDPGGIEAAITRRTRAIVPVHYGGVACNMDAVMSAALSHRIGVVEDAAMGVNATWRRRYLGSIGHLGAYSFHSTKNITCGEGGALLVNDPSLRDRAEIIRDKGTNRQAYLRGEVSRYSWVDIGSSYLPSDLLAACLLSQLEAMDTITARRREIYRRYAASLAYLASSERVQLPAIDADCSEPSHVFWLLLRDEASREALLAYLAERGIMATSHYMPLHLSPQGHRLGYRAGDLPRTEAAAARLLRLPLHAGLTPAEQDRVIEHTLEFFARA